MLYPLLLCQKDTQHKNLLSHVTSGRTTVKSRTHTTTAFPLLHPPLDETLRVHPRDRCQRRQSSSGLEGEVRMGQEVAQVAPPIALYETYSHQFDRNDGRSQRLGCRPACDNLLGPSSD